MKIESGFTIEKPNAFIPWGIHRNQLKMILGPELRCVSLDYYSISCESLGGMKHQLGFHFDSNARLKELEFFRDTYPDQDASYKEFQKHFEATFGTPTETGEGEEGFPYHIWYLNEVTIAHSVWNRFGLEEHMRIIHKPVSKFNKLVNKVVTLFSPRTTDGSIKN